MADRILLIDDDVPFCLMLKTFLEKKGFVAQTAFTAKEGLSALASTDFGAVITDIRLPDSNGLELLQQLKESAPGIPVILITGYTEIRAAVQAIRAGAFDYVGKPINPDEMLHTLQQALKNPTGVARETVQEKPKPVAASQYVSGIGSESKRMNELAKLVAPTNLSVLIQGDSGTGKEYLAKSIHLNSKRADKPFIPVDCGAIPKDLVSSEFFGHVKGSFTGAVGDKTGHFEAANGGTLFLDEVGNLTMDVQVQLLRAIQERKVKPVGSSREIPTNIRLIAATNENLAEAVKRGDFREDLFHRLNEFPVEMPRLADRGVDIMVFAQHFLDQANEELEREVSGFEPQAEMAMLNYEWPGNLREMKNTIRRSVLLCKGSRICVEDLPQHMTGSDEETIDFSVRANEESAIRKALDQANFNKSKAARMLDIDRKTLYNKLKLYNIDC